MPTTTTGSQNQQGFGGTNTARTMRDVAQNAMSTDTLIDIVQRLGLVDIVVNRLRARIEESDVDELINEVTDYFRRNPEMIVVALGTLTVAAAAVVFLTTRNEDEDEERSTSRRSARSADRDDIDVTPALGRTTSNRSRTSSGGGSSRRSTTTTRE